MIFGWIRDISYVCPSINATKMRTKDGKRIDRKNCCQHDNNMRDIWLQSAHTSKGKKTISYTEKELIMKALRALLRQDNLIILCFEKSHF
jgi:hypothetical protein